MDKMSPASKSKSKDKKSGKEPQKAVLKPSGPAAVGTGVSASAYNPLLGTFHTLESVPPNLSSSPLNGSGRFRTIDEGDEQRGGSLGALVECDTASNNGSWSGDSEDQKEKGAGLPGRQDSAPGIDSDKREKIRQKNEKKHQRQKEKRAQELQERCKSYLMSRKLEQLAQQLVGMGFSHERATMALILNEGRVEESVAWLLEGTEDDADNYREQDRCNLKIDISNELSRIAAMESKYSCSKQEVERVVVSCEGDLDKATDILRMQKQEQSSNPKPIETEDTLSRNATSHSAARQQLRLGPSSSAVQRRDDKDSNYTKASVNPSGHWESGVKNLQLAKKYQPKLERATKPQQSVAHAEMPWASSGGNSSISFSMAAAVPTAASKREPLFVAVGSEIKPLPPGSAREPVTVMQRPQPANQKQSPVSFVGSGWHPANSQLDIIKSSGLSAQLPPPPSVRNPTPRSVTSGPVHGQLNYQLQMGPRITPVDSSGSTRTIGFQRQQFMPSDDVAGDVTVPGRGNPSWQRTGAYPTLAAASSLGYFSGLGSGSSSFGCTNPVNWTDGGNVLKLDYTDIDWSLEATSPRSSSLMLGLSSLMKNKATTYDPDVPGSSSFMFGVSAPNSARGGGIPFTGFRDAETSSSEASGSDTRDWTSPFEGKDLFSLPRQFVTSPSL